MPRKKKYQTVEQFGQAVGNFFNKCQEEKKVPTKSGFAHFLGITRQNLNKYDLLEGYKDILDKAYELIEEHWVQLLPGRSANIAGVIFYLKNAFGWRDKSDMEHSGKIDLTDFIRNENKS
mgnify:CR=1 FL=1